MRKTIAILFVVGLIAAPSMTETMAPLSVRGDATFQQDGNNWTITTASNKTIINWSSFGVARGALVHFQQPNSRSSTLNRVSGSQASHINGMLTSNGSVYLLNPNGIVIGPSGIIRVADFVGSTLRVTDAEFLAGEGMNFEGTSSASIENYGKIEAIGGDIYLIARHVSNMGALTAPAGSANLVAGADVLLTQDNTIFVRPSLAGGTGIGVDNSGAIDAVVARLQADGNMYALAINNTGVVRATGSVVAGGQVLLRADGGSLVSSGSLSALTVGADGEISGGDIRIFGGAVSISGIIDASGETGGGFVETSGGTLNFEGMVLSCGDGGTWLLDPVTWTIDATDAALIVSCLEAGTSVTRCADSLITVAADVIAVNTPANRSFRLISGGSISIEADIDVGAGRLYLTAETGVNQVPGTTLSAGKLWLSGNGAFFLDQPDNDFGTVGFSVNGIDNFVSIRDVNDIVIGTVRGASGVSVLGGELHIVTPNGNVLANGLFPVDVVKGYHALGNVSITETSVQSGYYEIRISNELPYSKPFEQIEAFLFAGGALIAFGMENDVGSAVHIEFGDRAGDSLGYSWNFRVAETFNDTSANDYSFVVIRPDPGVIEVLSDLESARSSAKQDSGEFSWQTGWADESKELNHVDPYTLGFGAMNVEHPRFLSKLYLRDIRFTGHPIPPPTGFIYHRIFDHVDDFPHIRPDLRVSTVGGELLAPVLDELSTYFDESAQGTDPRYFYQSVGSIYQIPR